jgi:cardiolipin synthase
VEHWTLAYWIYWLSEWVIRLAMLVYVPQRRSPAAARTWLMLILFLPWPGLILYGIFGRIYLPRRRLELRERVAQAVRTVGRDFFEPHVTHPELAPRFHQAVTLAENLGDFPIVGGNRVELLPDYAPAIDRLVADIEAAQHHVHLLYYIFADDQTGGRVAEALLRAVQRGVQGRLLLDSLGSKAALGPLTDRLRQGGVEVTELFPVRFPRDLFVRRIDLRNHRKIAVLDGHVAYVGSQNIVNADFKPGIVYEELVARVTGPVVAELQAVLLADRYLETEAPLDRKSLFPHPEYTGSALAQVLPSGPGYPQSNNQRLIVTLLHAARERVIITTPYFIPDEGLMQALAIAAARRVKVQLIVSQQADQFLVGYAQRSYYEELLEAGVQIHLYRPRFLHAKHLTFDDAVAVIGSSNMDIRSFLLDAEVSLILYDTEVVAGLRAIQERYLAESEQLTLEEWRRRPFLTRTVQNVARLFDSLL